jgi:hypothetical protein
VLSPHILYSFFSSKREIQTKSGCQLYKSQRGAFRIKSIYVLVVYSSSESGFEQVHDIFAKLQREVEYSYVWLIERLLLVCVCKFVGHAARDGPADPARAFVAHGPLPIYPMHSTHAADYQRTDGARAN